MKSLNEIRRMSADFPSFSAVFGSCGITLPRLNRIPQRVRYKEWCALTATVLRDFVSSVDFLEIVKELSSSPYGELVQVPVLQTGHLIMDRLRFTEPSENTDGLFKNPWPKSVREHGYWLTVLWCITALVLSIGILIHGLLLLIATVLGLALFIAVEIHDWGILNGFW